MLRLGTASLRRHDRRRVAADPARLGVQGDRAGVHRPRARARRPAAAPEPDAGRAPISRENEGGLSTPIGAYAAGVYGGYFGAAQGIMLLASSASRCRRTCSAPTR